MEPVSCILLRNGALSVGIAPEWGAALTRFELRRGPKRVALLRPASRPQPGIPPALGASCFPLIPYAGRLRGGRFDFEGREVGADRAAGSAGQRCEVEHEFGPMLTGALARAGEPIPTGADFYWRRRS